MTKLAPINHTAFLKNPYIQNMGKNAKWTISTTKKAPCNAKNLIARINQHETNIYPEYYHTDNDLVTLPELDTALNQVNLQNSNRAYRLNVNTDRVLLIDVEPIATPKIIKSIATLPVCYAEHSMHGGYHMLLPIPETVINDNNKYLFDLMAVKGPKNMFELLLTRHFVTFTQRTIPVKQYDYRDDKVVNVIQQFLNDLVKFDKPRQQIRKENEHHIINPIDITNVTNSLSESEKIALHNGTTYIDKLKKKSPADYNNDISSYEFGIAEKCLYYASLLEGRLAAEMIMQNPFYGDTDPSKNIKSESCLKLAYAMLIQIVPPREKHQTQRNGVPLLMYDLIKVAEKSNTIETGIAHGLRRS